MGIENNKKQDCDCGTDCCTPKKSKSWTKIIFVLIIAAAATIIIIKLTGNDKEKAKAKAEVSGCDTTKCQKNDSTKKSCCPMGDRSTCSSEKK